MLSWRTRLKRNSCAYTLCTRSTLYSKYQPSHVCKLSTEKHCANITYLGTEDGLSVCFNTEINLNINRWNTTYFHTKKHSCHICKYQQRDQEPSWIPGKTISYLLLKNKKVRKRIRNEIKINVLRSYNIHCFSFVCAHIHEGKQLLNGQAIYPLLFNTYVLNKTRYSRLAFFPQKRPVRFVANFFFGRASFFRKLVTSLFILNLLHFPTK